MTAVNHLDIASGRIAKLEAGKFEALGVSTVASWLAAALACREDLQLPAIHLGGYIARAFATDAVLIVTVCRPSVGLERPRPLVSVLAAPSDATGEDLWWKYIPTVEASRLAPGLERPAAPWSAVEHHAGVKGTYDELALQQFVRSVAWAWLTQREIIKEHSTTVSIFDNETDGAWRNFES